MSRWLQVAPVEVLGHRTGGRVFAATLNIRNAAQVYAPELIPQCVCVCVFTGDDEIRFIGDSLVSRLSHSSGSYY